jgi:hypothetical protein
LEEFTNETFTVISRNCLKAFPKVKCADRTAYAYASAYSYPKTYGNGKRNRKIKKIPHI